MHFKKVIKSTSNNLTLNCHTSPIQQKYQIMFYKKSSPQDFIRRTLREMAREFLSEEEIGDIQDAFSKYTDHDGIINSHELGSVLRQIGLNPTDAELQVSMSLILFLWTFVEIYGHLWIFVDMCGHLWTLADI